MRAKGNPNGMTSQFWNSRLFGKFSFLEIVASVEWDNFENKIVLAHKNPQICPVRD